MRIIAQFHRLGDLISREVVVPRKGGEGVGRALGKERYAASFVFVDVRSIVCDDGVRGAGEVGPDGEFWDEY